jgi:dehydrogenase/reductase SDR family protein 12
MTRTSPLRVILDQLLELSVVGSFSRVGYSARRALFDWDEPAEPDLAGRVAVITGATGGLGLATAHLLARRGAALHLIGRDPARTYAARASVLARTPDARVKALVADLADLDSVRAAARTLTANAPAIDVLVHNAGALVHEWQRTRDGIEVTAQVHVVAPFLLTSLLLPQLRASGTGRVITVASGGMYTQRLDLDMLDTPPEPFAGARVYANAKRAAVVLNELWARHAAGRGIHFHAMHPGWADTPGVQASLPRFRQVMRPLLRSSEQGADTSAWLAGSPEALETNGKFWLDRRPRPTSVLPWTQTSDADGERLWRWCTTRAGVLAEQAAIS